MTILYPTDGSETAEAALDFALDIAKARNGKIIVLSVAEKVGIVIRGWEKVEQSLANQSEEFANEAVKKIQKRDIDAESHVEIGIPPEVILQLAKQRKVNAIVMGTHGWTGLTRAIIGSVADRVLRDAPCPVVLVPNKTES